MVCQKLLEAGRVQYLAAIERRFGVCEWLGHPIVHAQVEVAEDQDRCLEALSQVECSAGIAEALGHIAGQQTDVLAVAVTEIIRRQDIPLRDAGGQTGRWSHPHDVPDDDGDFGEVGQATEFVHQRQPWPRGRRHGAGTCPASADDDAGSSQFVFGLDDGVVDLFVNCRAQLGRVFGDGVDQTRRRRNWVPGDDAHTTDDRADAGSSITVNQNLAGGFVEGFDAEWILFGQMRHGVCNCQINHAQIEVNGFAFAIEVMHQGIFDFVPRNAKQMCDGTDIRHIGYIVAQVLWWGNFFDEIFHRHWVVHNVATGRGELHIGRVNAHATSGQFG